jgi:hypothetical protein
MVYFFPTANFFNAGHFWQMAYFWIPKNSRHFSRAIMGDFFRILFSKVYTFQLDILAYLGQKFNTFVLPWKIGV